VLEFCDPRIQQIKDTMGDLLKFEINHHSLNLYGSCQGDCEHRSTSSEDIETE
jgi:Fur family ferric uptake transcriptional regulator